MKGRKKGLIMITVVMLVCQIVAPVLTYAGVEERQLLDQIMQEINQENEKLDAGAEILDQLRYDYKHGKDQLTDTDKAMMWKPYNEKKVKKNISVSEARKEVKWLFRLLRSQYGLYTYYGSDAKFGKAQKAVLKEIGTTGRITVKKYQKLVHKQLGFITDAHLSIGGEPFVADVGLFGDESVRYIKKDGDFYREDSPQDRILAINGSRPDRYLKRAIDENGALTWYLYAMQPQSGNHGIHDIKITFQSGKKETVTLKPTLYAHKTNVERMYGYDTYDNLAYVEMNMAYMDEFGMGQERKTFLEDTQDMKKHKYLVFDLRNNPGGDASLVDEWFAQYTGQQLQPNYNTLRVRPVEVGSAEELREMDEFMQQYGMKKTGKYFYEQHPQKQFLENKGKQIFVLTSRQTSSAAEAMTDAFRNLENVVTIGTNTGGVFLNMANYNMAMPYSGLFLQYGSCLQYFDKDYFQESYGMEPDIYLTGPDLEQRLKKFFINYVLGDV